MSLDALLTGQDMSNAELHWIECNGRWGGVSIPMTAARNLPGIDDIDRPLIPHRSATAVPSTRPRLVASWISSAMDGTCPTLSVNLLIPYFIIARHSSGFNKRKVASIMLSQQKPDPHPDSPPREPDYPFTHPDDRPDESPIEQPPVEPSRQPEELPWTPERGLDVNSSE